MGCTCAQREPARVGKIVDQVGWCVDDGVLAEWALVDFILLELINFVHRWCN